MIERIQPSFTEAAGRVPWREPNYPVLVHREWTVKAKKERKNTLKHHPLYWDAKAHGDYIAAQQVVEDLLNPETVLALCEKIGNKKPIIVAPSLTKEDPKNVIPIWFAYNLAFQLDLSVSRDVFQTDKGHRTGRGGFYRLAHDPEFYGTIVPHQDYLIVDDVLTLGGTLASLRSFIESKGGNVLATTVLADSNIKARVARKNNLESVESIMKVDLNPTPEALDDLRKKHGKRLSDFWQEQKGYGIECLTAREVDFLTFYPTFREIKHAFFAEHGDGEPKNPPRSRGIPQKTPT